MSGPRRRMRGTVATRLSAGLCLLVLGSQPAIPEEDPWARPTLSFMGVPGMLDMPTAHPMRDADLSLSLGMFKNTQRGTMHFQITPRLSGVFRYVELRDFSVQDPYYDRSFDLRYLLAEEGRYNPAVTVGLQDFGGTGIYSGEYLVATKTFGRLRATGGIGWGRFGSYSGFDNPLGVLSDRFDNRPGQTGGIGQTGQLDVKHWFRGDAALFGGLQYAASDRLVLSAEYSSDAYDQESARMGFEHNSPFNFGAAYRVNDTFDVSAAYLYGSTLALNLTYTFNPMTPNKYPGGLEGAPQSVGVRAPGSAADLGWTRLPEAEPNLRRAVEAAFAADDLLLERFSVETRSVRVGLRTAAPIHGPQAVGRTARILSRTMPSSVERFEITLISGNGMPVTTVTLNRSDLEELEHAPDGSWQSFARARIEDAAPDDSIGAVTPETFPKFDWFIGPYLRAAYFDPENPVRLSFGAQFDARFEPTPGLVFQGNIRKQLSENISGLPVSGSALPRVRTDSGRYTAAGDLMLNSLTATKYFRPGGDLFGRVSLGYFEPMFGGVSGELLWKPVDSRLGLGLEVNYAQQREFDQGFGFRDYGLMTGHASAYYEGRNDFLYQVDAGRYLAGDWGATFGIDREFDNGIRIGAFATFTDVSFDDFGEGSFDKGIRFQIPIAALTGTRAQSTISRVIRPIQRDGGARLVVGSRLYEQVRQYRQPQLQGQWGRFWR